MSVHMMIGNDITVIDRLAALVVFVLGVVVMTCVCTDDDWR